jgi:hypothetical protein
MDIAEDDHAPSFGQFDVNNYVEFHTGEFFNCFTSATSKIFSDEEDI